MLKQTLALGLCLAIASSGCASASMGRGAMQTPAVFNPAVMAEYAQRIPPGSRVRLERTSGEVMRGTLIKSDAAALTLQRNTRVPEAPVEIPIAAVARLTLDNPGGTASTAKAIGIGVAAGVGSFFAILAILASSWD